ACADRARHRKKLAAFSAAAGRFLLFPIGDRRCNRTRASVGNAGGNARPSLTNATLAASRAQPSTISPHRVAAAARSWQLARAQYASVIAERDALKRELEWTKQSLAEVRDAMRELRAAVLVRQHAEAELASLYGQREIARARAAQRDPNVALN